MVKKNMFAESPLLFLVASVFLFFTEENPFVKNPGTKWCSLGKIRSRIPPSTKVK